LKFLNLIKDKQLAVAIEFEEFHKNKFGYSASNVEFKNGLIEKLDDVGKGLKIFISK
jgi:hypothetical protein